MKPIKQITAWVIVDPEGKMMRDLIAFSASDTKWFCRRDYMYSYTWKQLYRQGHRCRRCKIEVI